MVDTKIHKGLTGNSVSGRAEAESLWFDQNTNWVDVIRSQIVGPSGAEEYALLK